MNLLDFGSQADILGAILTTRLTQPDCPRELARARKQREGWPRERLVILAMDHPARRVTAAAGDAFAMANRFDVLNCIVQILAEPGVDGLLATPDIMEDVLVLNQFVAARGGGDFLAGKVLIGSMNRGGLAGTAFELDDVATAYLPHDLVDMRLDGGKMLLRLDASSVDTGKTLAHCVALLRGLAAHHLPAFLEPLAVPHSTDDLVKLVGVASALGGTSRRLWLKLPMADAFERVAQATTCPILLLGGDHAGSTDEVVAQVRRCMQAGENVRGLMIGRSVMYPRNGENPVEVAARLADCVHSHS